MQIVFSLERLSTMAVAGYCWLSPKFKSHLFYIFADMRFMNYENHMRRIAGKLQICDELRQSILDTVFDVFKDIKVFFNQTMERMNFRVEISGNWCSISHCMHELTIKELMVDAIDYFHLRLDSTGGIDRAAISASVLKSPKLANWKKYIIAMNFCSYDPDVADCYEDYVRIIGEEIMPKFPLKLPTVFANAMKDQPISVLEKLYKFPCSFETALRAANIPAMKYFWSKMSVMDQTRKFPPMTVVQAIGCEHLPKRYVPVIYFFLSKYGPIKGDEFLGYYFIKRKHPYTTFNDVIREIGTMHIWSHDELFRDLLMRMNNTGMENCDIEQLILGMCKSITYDKNYELIPHLLCFWNGLPDRFKSQFIPNPIGQKCLLMFYNRPFSESGYAEYLIAGFRLRK